MKENNSEQDPRKGKEKKKDEEENSAVNNFNNSQGKVSFLNLSITQHFMFTIIKTL